MDHFIVPPTDDYEPAPNLLSLYGGREYLISKCKDISSDYINSFYKLPTDITSLTSLQSVNLNHLYQLQSGDSKVESSTNR